MSTDAKAYVGHHVQVASAVKRYGSHTALHNIGFDVAPGEFLVLLGPSGSGKSTLIRSLAGIERLDAGEIHLGGQLASARGHHLAPERRNLAMVFQDYALWPHLTVGANVGYALQRRGFDSASKKARVHAILERVGLASHARRFPHELSGGEQQRVALARAIVAEPALLLFDEPLSNLDADLRERLRVEIATLTRDSGATAVYITHDQSEAFALADKIGVLDHGSLVQFDRPEQIYRRPATPFVARFTGVAGELTGQVVHHRDDIASVQVDDAVVGGRVIAPVRVGDMATVLIRPAASRITEMAAVGTTEQGVLHGAVVDVAYRGRGYDHVIAVGRHRVAAVYDSRARQRGEQVTVGLDAEHLLVYPEPDPPTPLEE